MEDDVCQVTSQVIPIGDVSLEGKVHVQRRNQSEQTARISRLGGRISRLIGVLSRLLVCRSRLKVVSRKLKFWFRNS